MKPIGILCVDDHPVVQAGIRAIITTQPDMVVVGQASDAETAIDLFRRLVPDVTLMDLHLPGLTRVPCMQ